MKYKETIIIFVAAVFMVLLINTIAHIPDLAEDVSGYPDMAYAELVGEYNLLKVEVEKPLTTGVQYFERLNRINHLQKAARKYERLNNKISDPRIMNAGVFGSPIRELEEINLKKSSKLGLDEIQNSQVLASAALKTQMASMNFRKDDVALAKFFSAVLLFQFGFIPFVWIIYAVRIHEEGGSIALEMLSNPFFPIYLMLWEIGIFRYHASGLKRQMRRMLHYASLTLSAALSFGGCALKAQTKKADKEDGCSGNNHTIVISGSTHYLSRYLGLDGAIFHPSPVLQSSLTIAHRNGIYANFWKSVDAGRSHLSPNFGREEEYTVGYNQKFGGRTFDFAMAYFNVVPLRGLPRGDLIQSAVTISNLIPKLPVSNYLWVRNVRPLRDGNPPGGWFAHLGAGKNFKLPKKMEFAFGGEMVYDSGAFGFKRAGVFRSSSSLNVPWKKLIFNLPVYRMSTPFTNSKDGRKFEQVLGIGLSFSFAQ